MAKPILALNSIRGKSGKDTLIGQIEEKLGARVWRVAFADILKEQLASVLTENPADAKTLTNRMHTSEKDSVVPELAIRSLPVSPYKFWLESTYQHACNSPRSLRWHLQQYGTGFIREFLGKPGEWLERGIISVLEGAMSPAHDLIVVTDMRMVNEYDRLTQLKAVRIRIVRNWFVPGVDDVPFHLSDLALMAHPFDSLIVNEWGKPEDMLNPVMEYLK